jgi:hypothetical protein
MILAVVDQKRDAHKLRHDRAGPSPRLDRILGARFELLLDLAVYLEIDNGPFLSDLLITDPYFPWSYFKRS